ncbi:MAG: zinc ribbon domain-containing protein [Chloroflexota bacterium]|nr:zinc ribbon domain-containing protein [Chloroflexota bacterium]
MPIYEYECPKCGNRFELRRSMSDSDDEVKCPSCMAGKPQRVFSLFGTACSEASCIPQRGFS